MATWWVILIGLVISLGLFGWVFTHFFSSAMNKEDANTIDPLPKDHHDEH